MRRIALEANADDARLGIIVWKDTFNPAKIWITVLDSLDKPLLHLHTQADEALPWSTIDMDFTKLTRTAHRDRESRFVQTRLSVPGAGRPRPCGPRASGTTCATSR